MGLGSFSGAAAAQEQTEDAPEIEMLDGAAAKTAAAEARATEEYRKLSKAVRDHGNKLKPNEIKVGRAHDSDAGTVRDVVSFEVEITDGEFSGYTESYLTIGLSSSASSAVSEDTEVIQSELEYVERVDDGEPKRAAFIKPSGKERSVNFKKLAKQRQSDIGAQRTELEAELSSDSEVSSSSLVCSSCKTLVKTICKVGCSAPLAFICGLLGITVIGGLSCLTFVGLVCLVIATVGCKLTGYDKRICADRRINLC